MEIVRKENRPNPAGMYCIRCGEIKTLIHFEGEGELNDGCRRFEAESRD